MNWLMDNKEWLFSGVGVLAIAALWKLVQSRMRGSVRTKSALDVEPLQSVLDKPAPAAPTLPTTLAPESIIEAIENTPLLQQPEFRQQFIGVQVAWSGNLADANKLRDGSVKLMISIRHAAQRPRHVFATVAPGDYPGLGLLRAGHPISVRGKISSVENYIVLEDAQISFELGTVF